ncbi:MAG: HigA family addiction module antitoxin, partial [bacterium]|nr:HigA family addiction module antitoxin [bacterium]
MAPQKYHRYNPDYAVAPGETVKELLENRCMSQSDLASRADRPVKTINEIINGKAAITPETAIQFEKILGQPASFWLNLENNYREQIARLKEIKSLKEQEDILKSIPVRHMVEYGWIKQQQDKPNLVRELQVYFGVSDLKNIDKAGAASVAWRKTDKFTADKWALTAWLRKGEIDSAEMECGSFNKSKFKKTIFKIREFTQRADDAVWTDIVNLCADSGVSVVYVRELPKLRANGATYWLDKKPVIQLSLRHKRNDILWFTFFHEVAHILLHGKKGIFIELDHEVNVKEQEADDFAAEMLIPTK